MAAAALAGCDRRDARDDVATYGADRPADDGAPAAAGADAPRVEVPHPHPVPPAEGPVPAGGPEQPRVTTSSTVVDDSTPGFAPQTRLGAGQLARVLLQPTPARRVVIEVLEQPGAAARAGTVEHLTETLRAVSRKPVLDGGRWLIPDDRRRWSAAAINGVADELARADHERDLAVVRVLFLRGAFDQGDSVLGVATRADTFAVFVDQVARASTALVGRAEIEAAVAAHELGHLLGLVDLVVDTGRADPDHPAHSRNRESVMYWAVESGLVTQVLSGGPPRNFDDDDQADLASIRNGA